LKYIKNILYVFIVLFSSAALAETALDNAEPSIDTKSQAVTGSGIGGNDPEPSGADSQSALGNGAAEDEKLSDDEPTSEAQSDGSAEESEDLLGESQAAAAGEGPDDDIAAPVPASFPEARGNGSLDYTYGIAVPAFHGIEPSIGLTYNSSRKTKRSGTYQGWLGYGWGLAGIDVIERERPRRGVPAFDDNDVFVLNGMELVPCETGTVSPSCATGGTHATEIEGYRRIVRDEIANTWTITGKDGTQTVLSSIAAISGVDLGSLDAEHQTLATDYRWYVTSVTDTHGNTVSYNYACDELPACRPIAVDYNGIAVELFWEDRPDTILMANGLTLTKDTKRIRAISVEVGTEVRNAYTLQYQQDEFSGTSQIAAIRRYGRGAGVSTGEPAGGEYRETLFGYEATQFLWTDNTFPKPATVPTKPSETYKIGIRKKDSGKYAADELIGIHEYSNGTPYKKRDDYTYTFDLKASIVDLVANVLAVDLQTGLEFNSERPKVFRSEGRPFADAFNTFSHTIQVGNPDGAPWTEYIVDQNVIYRSEEDQSIAQLNCPRPEPAYAAVCAQLPAVGNHGRFGYVEVYWKRIAFDHDGDGLDIVRKAPRRDVDRFGHFWGGAYELVHDNQDNRIWRFNGSQWQIDSNAVDCAPAYYGGPPNYYCVLTDLNGDGVTDLARFRPHQSQFEILLYTGSRFERVLNAGGGIYQGFHTVGANQLIFRMWDVNLDGMTDILAPKKSTFPGGDGPFDIVAYRLALTGDHGTVAQSPLFNLYGRFVQNNTLVRDGDMYGIGGIYAETGDGFGDVNGDGAIDAVFGDRSIKISRMALPPGTLTSVTNEIGGSADFEYKPSAVWENDFLPFVTPTVTAIEVSDGRTAAARTEYAYAGGKFDPSTRKFLGFREVIETKPAIEGETAGPTVETEYRQDLASYGAPERIVYKDGGGVIKKEVTHEYDVNADPEARPFTALRTATDTVLLDTEQSRTRTEFTYDDYGNLTFRRELGRLDVEGDERFSNTAYVYNTDAYIVSLPRMALTRNDTSHPQIDRFSLQYFFYDGEPSSVTPPVRGDLTGVRTYIDANDLTGGTQYVAYEYDAWGNRTAQIDGEGNRTEWDYDQTYNLFPVAERLPAYFPNGALPGNTAFETQTGYDFVCGAPLSHTDIKDVLHTFTYDGFCRETLRSNTATGHFTETAYLDDGDPSAQRIRMRSISATDTYGLDIRRFDGLGRIWRVETSADTSNLVGNRHTVTEYDARGNVLRSSHPYFNGDTAYWTENRYDWADRPVSVTQPDGAVTTTDYSLALGVVSGTTPYFNRGLERAKVTDPLGREVLTTFSTHGKAIRIRKTNAGANLAEERAYDALDRLVRVEDPNGAVWTYDHDSLGNRTAAHDPDLGSWSYTYDSANRLETQTDARGFVTTMAYDQMGRLLTRDIASPGGATERVATNTYDEDRPPWRNTGELTTATNTEATHSYNYGQAGKLGWHEAVIDGIGHREITGYNAGHNIAHRTFNPHALAVGDAGNQWTYTNSGLLKSIPGYIDDIVYEADGQTTRIEYANGVTTQFTYSPERRWLTALETLKPDASPLLSYAYTRDAAGRITRIDGLSPADSWIYTYDDLDQLVTVDNLGDDTRDEAFSYDNAGNMLSSPLGVYTYPTGTDPRPHAPLTAGPLALSYDDNGNMAADGNRSFDWDAANRLQAVVPAGGSGTANFRYGPDGARVSKFTSTTRTLYPTADIEIDATQPVWTTDAEGVDWLVQSAHTRYPHMDIKVVGSQAQFLHRDHLSSVRAVTGPTGQLVEQTGYRPYGKPDNSGFQTGKSWIGERHDPETGLIYLNARYHDPLIGRFISPDDWDPTLPKASAPTATPMPATARSTSQIRTVILLKVSPYRRESKRFLLLV
jgi:RHS repeat-associated protein